MGAASKAMVKLLLRADSEGGCFFVVKRAACLEFAAGALEGNTPFDNLDDIDTAKEFFDKRVRDQARHSGSQLGLDGLADGFHVGPALYKGTQRVHDFAHVPDTFSANLRDSRLD